MKILAVETATPWQSVAILDGDRVLARSEQEAVGSHAKLLLPSIDRLFSQTGLSPRNLDGFVVSIGPGSFTGLRVGLSTVLGFRTITRLPMVVVPTLEGMAWNLRTSTMPLCPVLNSRRGELYWAFFQWTGSDHLERLVPEQVGSPKTLGKQLNGDVILFGEGWQTEQAAIKGAMGAASITEVGREDMRPSAVSVGLAGLAKFARGEKVGPIVSPLYVQRSEAELKYEQSGGVSPVARRQEKVARKLRDRMALAGGRTRRKE